MFASLFGKSEQKNDFELSEEDKKQLLTIARSALELYIKENSYPKYKETEINPANQDTAGAFVTLYKNDELRGCIGHIESDNPLYKTIQSLTISSATKDYRFKSVRLDELSEIEIEISVLTPMKKISSIDQIEIGRHGIYIKKGFHTGTFLPHVATKTEWTLEEFLGKCARDKAHIGWDGWKDADLYTYEALKFCESDFKG
jgi:AmmeMemoRadiSam system protein A